MYAAIKINSQQEYKEAEKLLIEKGFKKEKLQALKEYSDRFECYCIVYEYREFSFHNHDGDAKLFENINEFLK